MSRIAFLIKSGKSLNVFVFLTFMCLTSDLIQLRKSDTYLKINYHTCFCHRFPRECNVSTTNIIPREPDVFSRLYLSLIYLYALHPNPFSRSHLHKFLSELKHPSIPSLAFIMSKIGVFYIGFLSAYRRKPFPFNDLFYVELFSSLYSLVVCVLP